MNKGLVEPWKMNGQETSSRALAIMPWNTMLHLPTDIKGFVVIPRTNTTFLVLDRDTEPRVKPIGPFLLLEERN